MTQPTYEWDQWDPRLKRRWENKLPDKVVEELGLKLKLDPPPTDDAADLLALAEAVSQRGKAVPVADIEFDAQGALHVTGRILKAVGLSTDHPVREDLKELRRQLLDAVDPPLFWFKKHFKRGRPRQVSLKTAKPEFEPPHWRHPAHPSYPSGHATMAYTWAYLLAAQYPHRWEPLMKAAECVAKRREAAGLHFASDSEAGRQLGEQIARALLWCGKGEKVERFREQYKRVFGSLPAEP